MKELGLTLRRCSDVPVALIRIPSLYLVHLLRNYSGSFGVLRSHDERIYQRRPGHTDHPRPYTMTDSLQVSVTYSNSELRITEHYGLRHPVSSALATPRPSIQDVWHDVQQWKTDSHRDDRDVT